MHPKSDSSQMYRCTFLGWSYVSDLDHFQAYLKMVKVEYVRMTLPQNFGTSCPILSSMQIKGTIVNPEFRVITCFN